MPRYATQDRFKISVSTLPGSLWDTISGQGSEREVPKMRVEAGGQKIAMPTRIEHADITITKVYDQDTDGGLYQRLAAGATLAGTSIIVEELDENGISTGFRTTYADCVLKGVSKDDGDANGQDVVKMTLTFTVGSVA